MPRFLIKRKIWIFAVYTAILSLLFFFSPFVTLPVKNILHNAILVPTELFSKLGAYFSSKESIIRENISLKKKIGDLSLRLQLFDELRSENERLRNLIDFKKRFEFNTISAEVIARDPNDWIHSFVIDKGELDGIRRDAAACYAGGLLGKVLDVQERTSSVMLITHPNFKAGAVIAVSRINGIVVGSGQDTLKMLYLPIGVQVPLGSTVLTSEFSDIFPRDIPIGKIVSIEKDKTGLYQEAIVKPFACPSNQEEVLCIK